MKKQFIVKLMALSLITSLSVTSILPELSVNALERSIVSENDKSSSVTQENFEEIKSNIKNYLVLNPDGTISFSEKTPKTLSKEYNLNKLQEHFNYLNEKVKNKEISINADFTINQPQVFGGQDKVINFWWGASEWYSYDNARHKALIATQYGHGLVGAGAITGAFTLIGGIAVGLGSLYWYSFATNLSYVNDGNGQRGVVVDMNWAGIYSIYSQ